MTKEELLAKYPKAQLNVKHGKTGRPDICQTILTLARKGNAKKGFLGIAANVLAKGIAVIALDAGGRFGHFNNQPVGCTIYLQAVERSVEWGRLLFLGKSKAGAPKRKTGKIS